MATAARTRLRLVVLAVCGVLLSGCSSGPGTEPGRSPRAGPDEVATYRAEGSGMDAALHGVLVRDGACLYVEQP